MRADLLCDDEGRHPGRLPLSGLPATVETTGDVHTHHSRPVSLREEAKCGHNGGMTPYRISVVCTGNICRSPMGEIMLADALEQAGVPAEVESAGTGDWHVGAGADHRAERMISQKGLDLSRHSARQFAPEDFQRLDLVLALDHSHLRALRALAPNEEQAQKVRLVRTFDPEAVQADDLDVMDPYYGDFQDFETTYSNIAAATEGIVNFVRAQHSRG